MLEHREASFMFLVLVEKMEASKIAAVSGYINNCILKHLQIRQYVFRINPVM